MRKKMIVRWKINFTLKGIFPFKFFILTIFFERGAASSFKQAEYFFMVIENLLKSLSFVSAAGAVVGNRLGYFIFFI